MSVENQLEDARVGTLVAFDPAERRTLFECQGVLGDRVLGPEAVRAAVQKRLLFEQEAVLSLLRHEPDFTKSAEAENREDAFFRGIARGLALARECLTDAEKFRVFNERLIEKE